MPTLVKRVLLRLKRFRSYGLDRLDRRVAKHLPKTGGFFVELGANDGVTQSNTYYLEKHRGWKGILVEPIPSLSRQCARNRPRSTVFNCACTDRDTAQAGYIDMTYCGLMSTVKGALGDEDRENAWIRDGERLERIKAAPVRVPCRTLSDIIASCGHPAIDFLSLDVEGYERQVLSGLDLSKHRPRFLLVETRVTIETEIEKLLSGYRRLAQPSPYDCLYQDESAA